MTKPMSSDLKDFASKRRFVIAILLTLVLLAGNAIVFNRVTPFRVRHKYWTAAEMSIDRNWNWGLATAINANFGKVRLTNLGDINQNGFLIPPEMAFMNGLTLDTSLPPMMLTPEQAKAVQTYPGTNSVISKTRCLNREAGNYCEVRVLSSYTANPSPKVFVGAFLSADVYGLVEEKLLNLATGSK